MRENDQDVVKRIKALQAEYGPFRLVSIVAIG